MTSDLIIIGGGPSGLSAAINGASEGLCVELIDNGSSLGGQAKESNAIENYPGFPDGVTGDSLMRSFVAQANKFDTRFIGPATVQHIERAGEHAIAVFTDDYQEYITRSVMLNIGVSYRRLHADGIGRFMGHGVYYGMPSPKIVTNRACTVAVIGGANSAGQAALRIAKNAKIKVMMYVRHGLRDQMSSYLVERIDNTDNITVCEGCSVTGMTGGAFLEQITYKDGDTYKTQCVDYMFIFIGATPRTLWLKSSIELDDKRFIRTWNDVEGCKVKYPYMTSMAGVFAAGDVRSGSTKRIATAIGEGAGALQMIHNYLKDN